MITHVIDIQAIINIYICSLQYFIKVVACINLNQRRWMFLCTLNQVFVCLAGLQNPYTFSTRIWKGVIKGDIIYSCIGMNEGRKEGISKPQIYRLMS